MITAYLTIDDIPTKQTPKLIDFLVSLNIRPIMFCWGQRLEECRNEAIYALKKGAVLQNHSYSHPHFSELSFEEAKKEILRNEELLESIYAEAGVKREYKLFRFPYGDQGGENKDKIQQFLRDQSFAHIDDRAFDNMMYIQKGQKEDTDVYWTFDYAEYNIRPGSTFKFDEVINRVDEFIRTEGLESQSSAPELLMGSPTCAKTDNCNDTDTWKEGQSGKAPEGTVSKNIILIHDHVETEECYPGYFEKQIKLVLERGIRFVDPAVIFSRKKA